ncbi:MAG: mandelate racemase/muconate lactonizing enzyme family protein [Acidobacteria bacterium]|nr:mandelate racemase/muconate lactonizing enzyme family protein [Acidobacteriota bacterium]
MRPIPLRRARLQPPMAAQAAAAHASSALYSITSVEAWNLRQPVGGRSWALVRLATREGLEGWGECRPLARDSLKSLRDIVSGTPANAYEALRVRLKGHPGAAAANIAALDILAKAAKAPLDQFLGGPTRFKLRAYTSLDGNNDDELGKALERSRAAGFKAFSVPAPLPPFRNSGRAFVLEAQKRMNALRRAAGEDCDFILNGLGRLTPGDAASLAAAFERFHLLWFDEPCSTSSLGALRKISAENVTPVAFGEGVAEASFFQNLLREDAIDLVRPELAIHGITGVRKIAALAEVYYVAIAPRHGEGPVNTAAALHLGASLPNFFIQHIPYPDAPQDREMRAALTGANIEAVKDGFATLSTQPGLGVAIRRDALLKYGEVIA